MPQAVWTGDLSFGLVNIPVKLYSATAPKRVRFHQYEAGTGRRIRYARVPTGPALSEPPASYEPPPERAGEGDAEPGPTRAAPLQASPESLSSGSRDARPPDLSEVPPPESGVASAHDPAQEPSPAPEEEEVPWDEVVKGYEVEPGRVVTVTPDELGSVHSSFLPRSME